MAAVLFVLQICSYNCCDVKRFWLADCTTNLIGYCRVRTDRLLSSYLKIWLVNRCCCFCITNLIGRTCTDNLLSSLMKKKTDWLLPCLHYLHMWLAVVVVVQKIWLDTVVFVHFYDCCVCIGYRRACTTNLIGFYRVCTINLIGYLPVYKTHLMQTAFKVAYTSGRKCLYSLVNYF